LSGDLGPVWCHGAVARLLWAGGEGLLRRGEGPGDLRRRRRDGNDVQARQDRRHAGPEGRGQEDFLSARHRTILGGRHQEHRPVTLARRLPLSAKTKKPFNGEEKGCDTFSSPSSDTLSSLPLSRHTPFNHAISLAHNMPVTGGFSSAAQGPSSSVIVCPP